MGWALPGWACLFFAILRWTAAEVKGPQVTWVQQGCNWVYTAADGSPLGTLEHLGQLWRLSVLQNGYMRTLGGWSDFEEAKRTVERHAAEETAQMAGPHADDCGCPKCLEVLRLAAWANENSLKREQC